ncbi:hypothetical protein [Microbacterium foliorum]|uniref:hypothetical protein n=1 Tax=Microbacterium foliorum TaxID=104336 RepID=UPI0028D5849A|nr:hypothetical protein [Microbacterium foliorum]
MLLKRSVLFASIALVAIALLIVGVAIVAILGNKPGPSAQYYYPIVWVSVPETDPESTVASVLRLEDDGTAVYKSIKFGDPGRSSDGRACIDSDGERHSGNGAWELDEDGALRIHDDVGTAVFLPDQGRFTGPDWSELRQPFCDDTYVDFSPSSERIDR